MNREEVLYLAPYIFSLLLSLGIFVYTWRHRQVRGARAYSWFVAGQTLTILGFIFELISPNLEIKIVWDKFQWLTDSYLVILPFLIFSFTFTEYEYPRPRLFWGIIIAFIGMFTTVLLTDSLHHLIYLHPRLSTDYPFPELKYDFTWVVYLFSILYVYGANLYGIGLLLRRAVQTNSIQRMQFLIVAVGFSIPVLLSVFSLLNIKITPQRDNAPFSIALGNLVVAWGLFRYGLFDIVPIARERIIENMSDPVIVLDPQNRVVDLNRTALSLLGKRASEVIGRPSDEAFAKWPFVVELLNDPREQRQEVSTKSKGEIYYFDVSISHIHNRNCWVES
jgi:PAS domain S-box-containing protein